MKRIFTNFVLSLSIVLIVSDGCRHSGAVIESTAHPVIPATVTGVRIGPMASYIEFNASSEFLYKAAVKSPVAGYIDRLLVTQGDDIKKGQLLYKLKTKEATALRGDTLDNLKFSGEVDVTSAAAGIISSIEHSDGDYVSEGDQLCQVALSGSFAFILDVPFELSGVVKLNTGCDIALSDSQTYHGIIRAQLPTMAGNSQTVRFIVKLTSGVNLPENLSGKIKIVSQSVKDAISLPKSSILTNETMQSFWVMKLVNDSVAVKIPVTTGITSGDYVQILKPEFKSTDLFLTSGNYGLADTVSVRVIKMTGDGQ